MSGIYNCYRDLEEWELMNEWKGTKEVKSKQGVVEDEG